MKTLFFLLLCQFAVGQIKTISGKKITNREFEAKIINAMDSLNVKGMSIAVINNGKVIYEKGLGLADVKKNIPVRKTTYFEAASLSKPVFCLFVLKLSEEGKINLDKPLFEYLPNENIKDERYKKITARMVLSHTTGLPNWSENNIVLDFDPGTRFSYSGEAFTYLAKVIAKISRVTLKDLDLIFQNKVAKEFKLKNFHFILTSSISKNLATAYQENNPVKDERDRSIFDPAGGLYANAESYSNFLVELMNNHDKYKTMFKPVIGLEENDEIRKYFNIDSWTLGLGIENINGTTNYWHGGNNLGYTNSFTLNLNQKFGYVFFTNADQCHGMKKIIENLLWK